MANGDDAAAVGMDVVNGSTGDVKNGYDEINKTRDYIAHHQTTGTHAASAINSGTLDTARIPDLSAAKITSGTLDNARLATFIPGSKLYGNVDLTQNGASTAEIRAASVISQGKLYSSSGPSNSVSPFATAAWKTSTGELGVAASSRRFKQDEKPAPHRRTLLLAVVKNYRMKEEVADLGMGAPWHLGLIAEDLHDLGLTEYVAYLDGEPFAINYDRIVCDLLMLVQDIDDRVAKLEKGTN